MKQIEPELTSKHSIYDSDLNLKTVTGTVKKHVFPVFLREFLL